MLGEALWLYISMLFVAVGASALYVLSAFFISSRKLPPVLRPVTLRYFNIQYYAYIASLLSVSIGLGIFVTRQFERIIAWDVWSVVGLCVILALFLCVFAMTQAFKKQLVPTFLVITSGVISSIALFVFSNETIQSFRDSVSLFTLLALFGVMRYGVYIVSKKIK